MTPPGGLWWVIAMTLVSLLATVGYMQNRRCKGCGIRKADCECGPRAR